MLRFNPCLSQGLLQRLIADLYNVTQASATEHSNEQIPSLLKA